jgi:hypothetical protein
MTLGEYIELVVDGEVLEFDADKTGEYQIVESLMKDVKIWSCMTALAEISARRRKDNRPTAHLTILLKEQKLPWEESILGTYFDFLEDNICNIEFYLNTAIGTHEPVVANTISSSITNSKFSLKSLDPGGDIPVFEEDGYHSWKVELSATPDATFGEFFRTRRRLSQDVFLPSEMITTPRVALRMVQIGQAQALLGYQESEWLECKSVAYECKNIHESLWKHELGVDVAQFANTESGGLLLIGFRTKPKASIDTIEKITPVPASDNRLQVYRDTLKERIYPPISRLLIEAFPWNNGEIVCIYVPPQEYINQPYLVSDSVIHGRYNGIGITIVRRHGGASIPITAKEIHSTLVAGRTRMRKRAEGDSS